MNDDHTHEAPTGVYCYYCTPHLALGMTGTITVQKSCEHTEEVAAPASRIRPALAD
ncbi:MAG: plastocyanin/azurin family copper-binding protein [Gemmatimonadaceae bacterium]